MQLSMNDARPDLPIKFIADEKRLSRKESMLVLCCMLFVGTLFVADTTGIKLFTYSLFAIQLMLPASTVAFSLSFLANDVVCELTGGRRFANKMIVAALSLRVLELAYYHFVIGGADGGIWLLHPAPQWAAEQQAHFDFVLGSGAHFAVAGLCATALSFLIDTHVFSWLREQWQGRNLYWLRNGLVTMLAQLIDSSFFITVAFWHVLDADKIFMTIMGQMVAKLMLAWLDTPLALAMRNFGEGRRYWYAWWKRDFYLG